MSKPNATTTNPQATEDEQESQQAPAEPNTPVGDAQDAERTPADAQDEAKGKGNSEAAKYRVKLRETEQERDALNASVETLRRQLVAGAMPQGSKLSADALWTTGRAAAEFFDTKGQLDAEKLIAAVRATHTSLGVHYGPDPVPAAGGGHSGLSVRSAPAPTWSDALKR